MNAAAAGGKRMATYKASKLGVLNTVKKEKIGLTRMRRTSEPLTIVAEIWYMD